MKDYDFAEEFGRCAAVALWRPKPYRPFRDGRRWVVAVDSKELYELLGKPIDIERIRPYVEHCEECMAAFIRGFADAEGSVDKNEHSLGCIKIANTNLELISYVQRLLEKLGIHSKIYLVRKEEYFMIRGQIYKRRKRVIYTLVIYRKRDKMRFRMRVNFTIARKRQVLELLK
ncbi:MAG: LAGLIDADG family homing endonuclease [Nitrososphaeria archaeon]|nr:LAGLIDADG family homing endonuclease [Nitrososphaeria archaeon]